MFRIAPKVVQNFVEKTVDLTSESDADGQSHGS